MTREFEIRQAIPEDAAGISAVLIASITELCMADHQNLPAVITAWTANKTPAHIAKWIAERNVILRVADHRRTIAGVGGYTGDGEVALMYVAPSHRSQGVSDALLADMERLLTNMGLDRGHLVSTQTAEAFYQGRGWRPDGPVQIAWGMPGQPMVKNLGGRV